MKLNPLPGHDPKCQWCHGTGFCGHRVCSCYLTVKIEKRIQKIQSARDRQERFSCYFMLAVLAFLALLGTLTLLLF